MNDDWYQQLMDDVQFGSRAPRIPLPYRAPVGPQFNPKDVPIVPAPTGQLHFDPSYSSRDARYLAGLGGLLTKLLTA